MHSTIISLVEEFDEDELFEYINSEWPGIELC